MVSLSGGDSECLLVYDGARMGQVHRCLFTMNQTHF